MTDRTTCDTERKVKFLDEGKSEIKLTQLKKENLTSQSLDSLASKVSEESEAATVSLNTSAVSLSTSTVSVEVPTTAPVNPSAIEEIVLAKETETEIISFENELN